MHFALLALLSACDSGPTAPLDASDSNDAGSVVDAGADGGFDSGPPPFVAVYDLLHARNCIYPCHDRTANGGLSLSPFDGFPARHPEDDLDRAYRALTSARATSPFCAGEMRIVTGEPDASLLLKKVAPGPAPCGNRMPAGEMFPRLTADEVEVLRVWISNGAPF